MPPPNLTRHLPMPGQIFVIALSILLALAVDAGWEWSQDRSEERELLSGLEEEYLGFAGELRIRTQRWDSVATNLRDGFQLMDDGQDIELEQARLFVRSLLYSSTWDAGGGVRDAMIAGGRLQVLRDVELRRALVAWDAVLREVQDNEVVMREFIISQLTPFLASRRVPVGVLESGAPAGLSLAGELRAYRDVFADPEFLALAGVRLGWLQNSTEEYRRAQEFVDETVSLIRANRSGR